MKSLFVIKLFILIVGVFGYKPALSVSENSTLYTKCLIYEPQQLWTTTYSRVNVLSSRRVLVPRFESFNKEIDSDERDLIAFISSELDKVLPPNDLSYAYYHLPALGPHDPDTLFIMGSTTLDSIYMLSMALTFIQNDLWPVCLVDADSNITKTYEIKDITMPYMDFAGTASSKDTVTNIILVDEEKGPTYTKRKSLLILWPLVLLAFFSGGIIGYILCSRQYPYL